MKCEEYNNLISGYLARQLPDEQQEAFEMHYFQCDNCFAQLKVEERLLSKEIPVVLGQTTIMPSWLWPLNWRPLAGMASLVLVVMVSVLFLNRGDSGQSQLLFQLADVSAPVYMTTETRDSAPALNPSGQRFQEAMQFYNQKRYSDALGMLNQVQPSDSNPQVTFFKGICLLYSGAHSDAVTELDKIIQEMNPSYYDEAIYYKAIALIRQDKKAEALEQLKNLAEMFSPFSVRAKEMLDKIEGLPEL